MAGDVVFGHGGGLYQRSEGDEGEYIRSTPPYIGVQSDILGKWATEYQSTD